MNYINKIKVLSILLATGLGSQSWAQCTEELIVDVSSMEICFGDELTLEASSTLGGTITWDNDVVNGETFIPVTAGNVTYTATSDNPDDCPFTVEVMVNELPEVAAIADDIEVCAGQPVTLTGSGALFYAWGLGVVNGESFIPVSTTVYEVTGSDVKGCESTATIEVVVNALPTVEATADLTDVCIGGDLVLTGAGAATYVWADGVVDGEAFTPGATATYDVTGTDANGCVNTATIEVVVNALPSVAANADVTEVCAGAEVVLTGAGAISYIWSDGVVNGEAFAPAATTTFEVTGTDVNGCENTASIEVIVNALPAVAILADAEAICIGGEVTLTGAGAESYVWAHGIVDGEAFAPASTNMYEVTGTGANGCVNTATIEVVVNALPTVEATADLTAVCIGGDLVLSGAGAATYVWADGVVDGEAFTPGATATYEVTGTDANGCVNTATIEVIVNTLPTVAANADVTEVCAGTEVVLTGAGAISYTWSDGVVNGEAFAPAATTTFEVTGTDVNGCENIASIEVIVNALPAVAIVADDEAICIGGEVTLTGAGAESYIWAHGIVDGEAFAPDATSTYEVTGTDANGCVNTATIEVVVNALPTVEATADLTAVCLGGDLVLTGAGAATYVWTDGIVDGEAFTPGATATYEVTGTDANGCVNTASIEVVVNTLPTVVANADLTEVCAGAEVVLTGAGAISYTWSDGVVDGEAFAPAATTTFEVTGSDANGCENIASVEVIVNALPVVAIIADAEAICIGEDVTLSGAGAESYVWSDGIVDGEAFAPAATATYEVTGTDAEGCVNTTTFEVVVNTLPSVEATADLTEVCTGTNVTLTGAGALAYVWTEGVVDGEAFAPVATTAYEVSGTDVNGCVNTATIEVVVNALPIVAAIAEAEAICIGSDVILTGTGAVSYDWTEGVVDGEAFVPAATATYEVTGTDANGCINTATIEVVVNPLPEVIANANDLQICLGQELILTGAGAETYAWDLEVVDGEGFSPEVIGFVTYSVVGTDVNGRVNTSSVEVETRDSVQIIAVATDEYFGNDAVINIAVFGGYDSYIFDWDNDGTGDFDDTEDLTDLAGGTYTVVVEDAAGCSTTETVVISSQLAVEESKIEVGVYPNPTTDLVTVSTIGMFTYEVTTITGAIILNGVATNNEVIALGNYPTGFDFVAVKSANQTATVKVIKQ